MLGYKVVRVGCVYTSSTVFSRCLTYEVGKITRPIKGDGPIAVFDNLEDARSFVGCTSTIFLCEYEQSLHRNLWYRTNSNTRLYCDFTLPQGTDFADSVKLLEEVV